MVMMTLVDRAREGRMTGAVKAVARAEQVDPSVLLGRIASGSVVIMRRGRRSLGIGLGLRTKVNVNIGTSATKIDPGEEVAKAVIAEQYGADTLTDLSMGGDIPSIRRSILGHTSLPVTTVPIYEAVSRIGLENLEEKDILRILRDQAKEGISSFVVHCPDAGILEGYRRKHRVMGIVSKGGSLTLAYMIRNRCENPFLARFDELLRIMRRYDIVLSLGNTMRSGCIHDPRDAAQVREIQRNVELAGRAHRGGVQVIIEGVGGHVRADRIASQVTYHKKLGEYPLFVAGPLPTDIAVGHDHIAGCVGASIAAGAGADYLCYITPAEHLGLPDPGQVKEGLIAFRIAAHIGDSMKFGPAARDRRLSERRAELDWEGQFRHALDGDGARELAPEEGPCTMCGDYCAIKMMRDL
ncbi:MAG: phosphomethylpyrimidine synthase ThiC [Methanomicrobiales archaeon]|nr:phosphomethylpyrimidine synthase ThiC [Methanomicrobiales archaeon]